MERVECKLTNYDVLLVDVDGVLWKNGVPLAENVEALKAALKKGIEVILVTNNSTRSRRLYSFLFKERLGLEIPVDHIVTSAYSAAKMVSKLRGGQANVLVIGEHGLVEELVGEGHLVLTHTEWEFADYVVVGLDRKLDYNVLSAATNALRKGGILFIATNLDPVLPLEDGVGVGSGGIVALLERASGRQVDYLAGKPSGSMTMILKKFTEGKNALFIGDRFETDMVQAKMLGVEGLLLTHSYIPEVEPWFCTAENLSSLLK